MHGRVGTIMIMTDQPPHAPGPDQTTEAGAVAVLRLDRYGDRGGRGGNRAPDDPGRGHRLGRVRKHMAYVL